MDLSDERELERYEAVLRLTPEEKATVDRAAAEHGATRTRRLHPRPRVEDYIDRRQR